MVAIVHSVKIGRKCVGFVSSLRHFVKAALKSGFMFITFRNCLYATSASPSQDCYLSIYFVLVEI